MAASFEGLQATEDPVETVLHGQIRDQGELFGTLDRLQALGLELVEVRRVVGDSESSGGDDPGSPSQTVDHGSTRNPGEDA